MSAKDYVRFNPVSLLPRHATGVLGMGIASVNAVVQANSMTSPQPQWCIAGKNRWNGFQSVGGPLVYAQ